MGKFAKVNRENAAKGYIRALLRSQEPVIINDEAVLHIVLKTLGNSVSVERIETHNPIFLFHDYTPCPLYKIIPPGRISRLILSDRMHGIDPAILPKLKEDLRNASDKSEKTILNLTMNRWPKESKFWHYFRLSFKVQRIL